MMAKTPGNISPSGLALVVVPRLDNAKNLLLFASFEKDFLLFLGLGTSRRGALWEFTPFSTH